MIWRRHRRRLGRGRHSLLRHPHVVPQATTLDQLPIGARGTVHSISGDRRLRRRMMEMGILEGSRMRVVKFAPTGNPIQIKVNDYFLSIRKEDAANIVIQPGE